MDTVNEVVEWLERHYDTTMQLSVYGSDVENGLKYTRATAAYHVHDCYARPMFEIKPQN